MDFYRIAERPTKSITYIYPDFVVRKSEDLMVRGRSFYAIWDEARQIWSTNESDVPELVDEDLLRYADERSISNPDDKIFIKTMRSFESKMWTNYKTYLGQMYDNYHELDKYVIFADHKLKKTDYASKKLPYSLSEGSIASYDEIMSVLYSPVEREKLEWAIGSILAGDSRNIQKFVVLYGEAGSGKSTFLNIVEKLFEGYTSYFDAKSLGSNNNSFATEAFKSNPLVAIQHDGDLSKIEDNTKLNSIISHEYMSMNEKYKPTFVSKTTSFLFMGTNKPVRITDAKSGIIRRLIDVTPTGDKIPTKRYFTLMSQIDFELGSIANHCLNVYRKLGKNYYSAYRPMEMMYQTDIFFNFVETNYYVFKKQEGISLAQAYEMYKIYCDEALIEFKMPRHKFREELKSYFGKFHERIRINGEQVRSYYSEFLADKIFGDVAPEPETPNSLTLDSEESILDDILSECKAQYATVKETPEKKWDNISTTLKDLDTKKLHYVQLPDNHIVIDFDLKDETGAKSMELNLTEASKWPTTYAEFSKSGAGIHLHYIWEGDPKKLQTLYSEGIEVKAYTGNSSLRRKLTKCNNAPVATISSGLPLKGDKMLNDKSVQDEKNLRNLINKNLRKEIHPGTKPSIDFIFHILEKAYDSGMAYDVTDMRPQILAFANNSSNQASYCISMVQKMKFKSEEVSEIIPDEEAPIVFFDVEVFPNLFVVVWKKINGQKVSLVNPAPQDLESLLKMRLVGFNCRRYDNHILYAAYIGYDNEELYNLSQRIINGSKNAMFSEAYNLSYTDIYEFSSKKQGLKKFEIELGIHHMELGLPWDQPVPEELWPKVVEYCGNDVDATEATFEARKQDFVARLILSDLSGLSPNDTTQQHAARIIFGTEKKPQEKFIYTDLSKMFPGYKFEKGVSTYKNEEVSEGGYVHAEPGMYSNVFVLDVESMHPNSAILLDIFGPYTKNFKELLDARIAIKHKDFNKAKEMLDGILTKYLTDPKEAKSLAYALKIIINIVYGLTSAKFENKFKDPRNIDNIVAKRGALFMIDLKYAVQEKGFKVIHIKTDSIKIPDATPEIIQFVKDFGKQYGYNFLHETTYEKFCLVNDAVYIAKVGWDLEPEKIGKWDAVGTQFQHPYVFKSLFSKEPIVFSDLCETKNVSKGTIYLDMNEELGEEEHDYHFIGKTGQFCPILPGKGGGVLYRESEDKYYAVTGTKGRLWLESEMVKILGKENDIDLNHFNHLVDEAIENISKYGDFEWFVEDINQYDDVPPWFAPCGENILCFECSNYWTGETAEQHLCKKGYDISNHICVQKFMKNKEIDCIDCKHIPVCPYYPKYKLPF